MIAAFGSGCARFAQRWVPSSFVFALVLNAAVLAAGLWSWSGPDRVPGVLAAWYEGFWSKDMLAFAFQMTLMLVAGYALADAPLVRRALRRLAGSWRTPRQAVMLAAAVSAALSWLNWGLGLVAGAFLAREVGAEARRRGQGISYPLVAAAAYGGFLHWHGGLSGSAPLSVAQSGHMFEGISGVIPVSTTLFSGGNLLLSAALLLALPLILGAMAARAPLGVPEPLDGGGSDGAVDTLPSSPPLAERLNRSRLVALLALVPAAAALALVLGRGWVSGARGLDLNTVLFLCLFAAFALHGTPAALVRAFAGGAKEAGGIVLQFPFYFAILGVMRESGLVERLADAGAGAALWAAEHGAPVRWVFLVQTWLVSALVNLAVPSGGGQWAVQGEVVLRTAGALSVPPGRAVMALAYGDEWTNLMQPFWALALLAVTRTRARDIFGYTLALMLLTGPLYLVALAL